MPGRRRITGRTFIEVFDEEANRLVILSEATFRAAPRQPRDSSGSQLSGSTVWDRIERFLGE
jgi:hypothetical protein